MASRLYASLSTLSTSTFVVPTVIRSFVLHPVALLTSSSQVHASNCHVYSERTDLNDLAADIEGSPVCPVAPTVTRICRIYSDRTDLKDLAAFEGIEGSLVCPVVRLSFEGSCCIPYPFSQVLLSDLPRLVAGLVSKTHCRCCPIHGAAKTHRLTLFVVSAILFSVTQNLNRMWHCARHGCILDRLHPAAPSASSHAGVVTTATMGTLAALPWRITGCPVEPSSSSNLNSYTPPILQP